MGYPYTRFLDDPTWAFTHAHSLFPAVMPNAFRTDRTQIGLVLHDGVREVELSSITDTYPRSTVSDVLVVAAERAFVRTAHGLELLPRVDFDSAPSLDRVRVPGRPDAASASDADRWAADRGLVAEPIHAAGDYPTTSPCATWRAMRRDQSRPGPPRGSSIRRRISRSKAPTGMSV